MKTSTGNQKRLQCVPCVSSCTEPFSLGPEKKDKQPGGQKEKIAVMAPDIAREA